ncbi:aldo/keto reductase [Sphingobium sp. BHU LFT2]|uniref:aldo/keto reductase n=1 Tax=Sphingobium sp. BHU LFT2 TaxID=2807634 RepID=UPI0033398C48
MDFVAFSPLARGLFAGVVNSPNFAQADLRASMPRFREPNFSHNLALFGQLQTIAQQAGCTPAQLCLAWLLSRRPFIVPIPGTTNTAHLEEYLATLSLDLPDAVFAMIDYVFTSRAAAGARYSRAAQAQIDTKIWLDEELDT